MVLNSVYLLSIVFTSAGGYVSYDYHPMQNMAVCIESIKEARQVISNGAESEGSVTLVCVDKKAVNRRNR